MQVPKYHIYIEYSEKEKSGIRFNVSHEELLRVFATPFAVGQPFWFMGRLLSPIKVIKAVLFWSYETADKLTLPNHESLVVVKDKKYLIESVLQNKVKGAYPCTEEFLQPEKIQVLAQPIVASSRIALQRIFVVSGSDDYMKQAVLGALAKLKIVPVLTCEEPSQGRKIVDRFNDYEDMAFAVVLLSPDDFVYCRNETTTQRKLKPQQNVVFQLGFLLGKLGKSNVFVLLRECENFQVPDFEGLKTVAFDDRGSWKLTLIRELYSHGFRIEAARIVK